MVNPSNVQTWKVFKTFQVSRIGRAAREILRAPNVAGTVLAVVTNAVYVEMRDSEILWLVQPHLPAHPRAILAQYDANVMRVGMQVRVANERMMIGDVAIDLRDVVEWQPMTITKTALLDAVRERVVIARSGVCDKAISKLLVGDCCTQTARYDQTLRNLIGLGAGLTPAGDDFVGGLLFAAHHLENTYPKVFHWDARPVDELIKYARTQTNKISFAILCDLAHGQGPEPLHDFMDTLLSEEKPNDLQSRVIRVLAIGHSTGHAMLDGILTGIELMMNGRSN